MASTEGDEDLEDGNPAEVVGPENAGALPTLTENIVWAESANCVVDDIDEGLTAIYLVHVQDMIERGLTWMRTPTIKYMSVGKGIR